MDINNDQTLDYVYSAYNPNTAKRDYYARYWDPKLSSFSSAVFLRSTTKTPILVADMNGDGYGDFIESSSQTPDSTSDLISVYGLTNNQKIDSSKGIFAGVLMRDAITEIKVSINYKTSIEYQTLIKSNNVATSNCIQNGVCQDFLGGSQYFPLSFNFSYTNSTTTRSYVDTSDYYRKTNEPFMGSENPFANENIAHVSQYFSAFNIVTNIKKSQSANGFPQITSNEKYYYWVMRAQAGGRGLLGFEKTIVDNIITGEKIETDWRQDWPYTGAISNQRIINNAGNIINDKFYKYAVETPETSQTKHFKLNNKLFENIYSDSNSSSPTKTKIYINGELISEKQASSQSSSSSSSVNFQQTYPALELNSPNTIETYKLGQYSELAVMATVYSSNGVTLKNSDGTNPKITFYINGALQTSLRPDPDSRIKWWKPSFSGEYVVEAKATLDNGEIIWSKPGIFKITQDGAPTVNLTNPNNDTVISQGQPISISAKANGIDAPIKSVSFYVDGILIGNSDDSAPYITTWVPSQAGDFSFSAVAMDYSGKKTTSASTKIHVTSQFSSPNSSTSSNAPAVYVDLGSPSLDIIEKFGLGAEIALYASAKNPDGTLWLDNDDHKPQIDYYANNVLITDLRKDSGGSIMWWKPTSIGLYSIKAVAQLGGGRTSESKTASINVLGRSAPKVKISSPSSAQTFIVLGEEVTLSASATDDDGDLAGIAFYANNTPISNNLLSNTSPTINWKPTYAGNYKITAIAIDSTFIKVSSSPIMVTVIDKASAELTTPSFLNTDGLENFTKDIDTDGSFTLHWSGSIVADYYVLREGDNEIYKGAGFSKALKLKLGTYNFKLKACQTQPARCSDEGLKTIKVTASNDGIKNIVDLTIPSPNRQQVATSGQQFGLYAEARTPTGEIWRAPDGAAATMTYYANGIKLGSLTSDSSGALWFTELTQPGVYSITAEAILDDGTKVTSEVGTVTVKSNSAPVVSMISPEHLQRTTEGKSLKLAAQVTDNENNIAQVMFLVNGTPIGKGTTTSPYEMQWTPPGPGTYNISVRATDSGGLQSQSTPRSVIVDRLSLDSLPSSVLSPDYNSLSSNTKVMRAENEQGDVLVLSPPNISGISYNPFSKFVVGQPLKIINIENKAAGTLAAKLIVIDAQQITLNNTIEIVGVSADVLIINSTINGKIQCLYCSFSNVNRITLAAAQPATPLAQTMTQIGKLLANGEVTITTLKAPAARVELMGRSVSITKNDAAIAINTQQKASLQSNNEYILDDNGDKLVGTGTVNLISGQTEVDYGNFTALSFSTDVNTSTTAIEGNIRSGGIKVVAASSLIINGQLSTHSDLQASLLDNDEFKLANERIELTTLDQINGNLTNNGSLVSDDKIKLTATGNIFNNATGTLIANHIEVVSAKNITNTGMFSCPNSVCDTDTPPLVTDLYLAAEGVIDNQNSASGFTDITLTSGKDLNNRFGGTISASNIYLNSKAGSIRNGWATPYEDLPEDSWVLQPSAYAQQLSTFDQFILPNIKGSQNLAKKARTKEAYIVGDKVIINAYKHVENINPSIDVYRNGTSNPADNSVNANSVSIAAAKRLEIRAHGYILNSSGSISVESNSSDAAMLLMAPQIHNERYFMLVLGAVVNEQGAVVDTTATTQTTTSTASKNLESRLYVYSPAGVIFSNAPTRFKFDEDNSILSLLNPNIAAAQTKGFENNTSYFIVENDMEFQGAGSLVRSKGVLLERENYYLKKTIVTKDLNCKPKMFRGFVTKSCEKSVNTINQNPLGETVQETIERTIFAVSGQLYGAPANFIGINENPLDKAKDKFVDEYKKAVAVRLSNDTNLAKGSPYESTLLGVSSILTDGVDGPYIVTTARYKYLHPENIPTYNPPTESSKTESKSVWAIITEGFSSLKAKFLELLDEFEKGNQ